MSITKRNRWHQNSLAVSKGTSGEEAALYWFNVHNWTMFRTQPPVKTIGYDCERRRPLVIFDKKGGIADYTGFRMSGAVPVYTACECKCHDGPTMPCSVLSPEQRDWMAALPDRSAWVFILWNDGLSEVFPFKREGSYKKGKGIKAL